MAEETIRPILIVEDSDEDFEVLEIMFKRKDIRNPLFRLAVGDEVLPFLQNLKMEHRALPGLIILDLNIIGIDGREVLKRIKADDSLRTIPVAVYSTSSSGRDVEACYNNGANSYSVKPVDFSKLEDFVESIKKFWLTHVILPT